MQRRALRLPEAVPGIAEKRELVHFVPVELFSGCNGLLLINTAILILSGATFHGAGSSLTTVIWTFILGKTNL